MRALLQKYSELVAWLSQRSSRWRFISIPIPLDLLFSQVSPQLWTNLKVLSTTRRIPPPPPPGDKERNFVPCRSVEELRIKEEQPSEIPLAALFPMVSTLYHEYTRHPHPATYALGLSKFEHLTRLIIYGITHTPTYPSNDSRPSVLCRLQSLEIRVKSLGRRHHWVITYLTCPALSSLTLAIGCSFLALKRDRVDSNTALLDAVTEFQDRSAMKLKNLSLAGTGVEDFVLRKWIESNPSVSTVELDRWPYLEVVGKPCHLLPLATQVSIVSHLPGDGVMVNRQATHRRHSLLSYLSFRARGAEHSDSAGNGSYPGAQKIMEFLLQAREPSRIEIRLHEDREWIFLEGHNDKANDF
jgi:hypothetical protein